MKMKIRIGVDTSGTILGLFLFKWHASSSRSLWKKLLHNGEKRLRFKKKIVSKGERNIDCDC